MSFRELVSPIRIGGMELRNRMIMPAMGEGLASHAGEVTQAMRDYYEARARGGAAVIIIDIAINRQGVTLADQPRLDHDSFVPGLRSLVEAIQRHGAKAAVQLHHAGPKALQSEDIRRVGPQNMTSDEVLEIIDLYDRAARRAKQVGFDGIEVMAARGYLVSSFLSAAYNKRSDEWGGSLENRSRFFLQILRTIRQSLGTDYPLWCRIDGEEWGIEDGISFTESRQIAALAQQAGANAISVFGGDKIPAHATILRTGGKLLFPSEHPHGFLLPAAAEIKKAVTIPVIGVGRINPETAEKSIREGKVDIVALGRALIADPDLPNKVIEDRLEDIIPCIACLRCRDHIFAGLGMRCTVNPATGREGEMAITPAETAKNVLVVGGGPSGMQAALAAKARGHIVTLVERGRRLGGSTRVAGIVVPPIQAFTRYQITQVRKQGIDVRLNTEITQRDIELLKPDAVIWATGGKPQKVNIKGADQRNVLSGPSLILAMNKGLVPNNVRGMSRIAWQFASLLLKNFYHPGLIRWALRFPFPIGRRVVIIGGGFAGLEIADFFANRGRSVTVLEETSELGHGLGRSYLWMYLERLQSLGVPLLTDVKIEEITAAGVKTVFDGKPQFHDADTVLLAAPLEPDVRLGWKGRMVGDAADPGKILEATSSGLKAALEI